MKLNDILLDLKLCEVTAIEAKSLTNYLGGGE